MIHKVNLVKKVKLSALSKTTVKFDENLEFDVVLKCIKGIGWFQIENVKGDLKITRITTPRFMGGNFFANPDEIDMVYDELKNTFVGACVINSHYTFYITANIKMKETNIEKYKLYFCSEKLCLLKPNEFIRRQIILPGISFDVLTCYIKKIQKNELTGNDIEVHIENPYNVEIEGEKGDLKTEQSSMEDIDLRLTIVYDPLITMKPLQPFVKTNAQETLISESRPQSTLPSESTKEVNSYWYEIMSNERYSDAFLIASNKTKVSSHRCVLAEHSQIFAKIIDETSELPVTINVEEFNAEIIKASMDFLYGKNDSIKRKENEIFKFAVKYNIKMLMDACCTFFEESVNPANVCEFIQIAYLYNFEELKQKCLKVLAEKKKEIDPRKFADLSKNILIDAFCL
uniref:BTB domain-containing protein n=1 Tax=Panagrolaimus davidi TaxID=227884 RepID=A0A914P8D7_9BILA